MLRTPRALLVLPAVAACALAGCRPGTVSVAYDPQVGDRYEYRYEIEARVTRAVEGGEPEVVEVDTELVADQEVQAVTGSGARIAVRLTREGGVPRTAVVLVDRAGSLAGVELVDDLDAAVFGVAGRRARSGAWRAGSGAAAAASSASGWWTTRTSPSSAPS
jgi:hypothetical protein